MKRIIRQAKKVLAAFLAVVIVMSVAPVATVMADELGSLPREGYEIISDESGGYFITDSEPLAEDIGGQVRRSISVGTTVYTFVPPVPTGASSPIYYWYIFSPGVPVWVRVPGSRHLNRENADFAATSEDPTALGSNY